MKKLILLIAIGIIAFQVEAQAVKQKNVPEVVVNKMKSLYPDASKIKWVMDDGMYIASFTANEKKTEVVLSKAGIFSSSDTEITVSQLPAEVTYYLVANFDNIQSLEVEMETDANGIVTYEIEVDGTEYIFSPDGKLLKQIDDDDDDDDENEDED